MKMKTIDINPNILTIKANYGFKQDNHDYKNQNFVEEFPTNKLIYSRSSNLEFLYNEINKVSIIALEFLILS